MSQSAEPGLSPEVQLGHAERKAELVDGHSAPAGNRRPIAGPTVLRAGRSALTGLRPLDASVQVLTLLVALVSVAFYFNFTAEDAYITYRYAENLVDGGALTYNKGEPINAMTSPLHAMVSAVLYVVTGQTALSNKLVGVLLLVSSTMLVWRRLVGYPRWQSLVLVLVLLPSSVLLWTLGGLETPLLLFLATGLVVITDQKVHFDLSVLCGLFFLASLAFLARYDSVLFFLPILLHAVSKARSPKHVFLAVLGAAVLPAAWLAVSLTYYGDLLPTSFYVKTPEAAFGRLVTNGSYIGGYLLYVGLIPTIILALLGVLLGNGPRHAVLLHLRSRWWLVAGLLLELLYGLTMATHHMMFSFRFFVPYLPAAALLVVELARRAFVEAEGVPTSRRKAGLLAGFILVVMVSQVYQIRYAYTHSVNGLSPVGEYRLLGIRDYVRFMDLLKQEAVDVEAHWTALEARPDRQPRIITFAAGILPYTFRDSYIYEKLVSYRHCHERYQQARHADYIHILAPRQGAIDQQLPKPAASYSLVSKYEMHFDGSLQEFLVYYNPEPEAHNLTATINEPCQKAGQSTSGGRP